ncbi:periplasmic flagellar collar protein FlcA [Breznakiellaceae bacterium SP9]
MPSLQDLADFKTTFLTIAGEDKALAANNPLVEDLPLPDKEPVAAAVPSDPSPSSTDSAASPSAELPDELGDLTDLLGADSSDESGDGDFSFTDFLDPDAAELGESPAIDLPPVPDPSPEPESTPLPTLDEAAVQEPQTLVEEPDENLKPAELDVTDNIDMTPPLEDLDDGFDMGGELLDFDTPEALNSDAEADSFDKYNLEEQDEFNIPDDKTAEAALGNDFANLEDYDFPSGIDETFDNNAAKTQKAPENDVEEIQLSEEDFEDLQDTLNSYPLNLRVAIEEIIAEQAVAPELMSSLVKLLVKGGSPREAAALAAKILGRRIAIPKAFEKKTGEEMEQEQASFKYFFIHKAVPIIRLAAAVGIAALVLLYLGHQLLYKPISVWHTYSKGHAYIEESKFAEAKTTFKEAYALKRGWNWLYKETIARSQDRNWFFAYAEAFKSQRQYDAAAEKYDELLFFYPIDRQRRDEYLADNNKRKVLEYSDMDIVGPRDKQGVLAYAQMETERHDYAKADTILRRKYLDFAEDADVRLALGDNALLWGETAPAQYEYAREAYALLLEKNRTDPILERMLKYFIYTDNLKEVLPLQYYFMADNKKISSETLSELGGYLLHKKAEVVTGVPDEYLDRITDILDVLAKAIKVARPNEWSLPITYYHLSQYYNFYDNHAAQEDNLRYALELFDGSIDESSPKRLKYWLDARLRYAECLIQNKRFFPAEEQLVKGIAHYENSLKSNKMAADPAFAKLYANWGDIMYFTRPDDDGRRVAIEHYEDAESKGWDAPEMFYRMGAAHYRLSNWEDALKRFYTVFSEVPLSRRLLYALGNASYKRGDYFAAQNYYSRLLHLLENERSQFPQSFSTAKGNSDYQIELAERIMVANNNLGVTLEALTTHSGTPSYRNQAMAYYTESTTQWEALSRDPVTMVRPFVSDYASPGTSLAFLNYRNVLYPRSGYEPQLYIQIDKDLIDNSTWEILTSSGVYLSDVPTTRPQL